MAQQDDEKMGIPQTPDKAAEARARIAGLSDTHLKGEHPLLKKNEIPAAAENPEPAEIPAHLKVSPSHPASMPAEWVTHKKKVKPLPSKTRPIVSAIASFALLLIVFKSEVIISQVRYWTGGGNKPTVQTVTDTQPQQPTVDPAPIIDIPKINVHAPVVYEPSIAEADVLRALQDGVDHYGTTPSPGQPGNSVLFGHSSNDWWQPGNYKFIFVLLDKLTVGDKFSVNYHSTHYVYEVTGTKIVAPTDLSVLTQTTDPTMTLITCTPPGTSWRRLIVSAKQISPSPEIVHSGNTPKGTFGLGQLPGNAPDFLDQLKQLFNQITGWVQHLFT